MLEYAERLPDGRMAVYGHQRVPLTRGEAKRAIAIAKQAILDLEEYLAWADDAEIERVRSIHWIRENVGQTCGKKKSSGYVYLLWCEAVKAFKIGYSAKVQNRINQLSHLDPVLIHLIPSDNCYALEQALHIMYRKKWVGGELFNLSDKDVDFIKSLDCDPA